MNTVIDALILCGVSNTALTRGGLSPAERISNDIFSNEFKTCIDVMFKELKDDFKTYSELTVNEGRI